MLSLRGFAPVWFINFRLRVVMLVYVGETSRHFSRPHVQSSGSCRTSCTLDCFQVLDSAATEYQVKLKESMFIKWEKPYLNQQVKHINLTLSL